MNDYSSFFTAKILFYFLHINKSKTQRKYQSSKCQLTWVSIFSNIYTHIFVNILIRIHIYIYKIYVAEHEKQDICTYIYIYIYIYLWQDNDQFVSKVKHVITNKKESFSRKGLASIRANMVNIIKRCYSSKKKYSKRDPTASKDTTARQLMQQT